MLAISIGGTMPLVMERSQIPTRWAGEADCQLICCAEEAHRLPNCVNIALVNNMPDAALEDTEAQFLGLLRDSGRGLAVYVKLFSLPNICRGERAQRHLDSFYSDINSLLLSKFDGMIMTGTEPRQPNLREEPYWASLAEVLDWAEENTTSTILSCLAAHAGVLHSDGISRRPVGNKQSGMFEYRHASKHFLTADIDNPVCFPHSRWNEVPEADLTACGYQVLTHSSNAGVDLFVKEKKQSMVVHCQGHPEYGSHTLMKEYRRDVRRYLRKERETYPTAPHGYFDANSMDLLAGFRELAVNDRREELMALFPEEEISASLKNTWRKSATSLYANWLQYMASRKAQRETNRTFARTAWA